MDFFHGQFFFGKAGSENCAIPGRVRVWLPSCMEAGGENNCWLILNTAMVFTTESTEETEIETVVCLFHAFRASLFR